MLATINEQIGYLDGLADAIDTAVDNGKGINAFMKQRGDLWAGRYNQFETEAYMLFGANEKLEWTLGATEEHCKDCLYANGRVHRAKTWKAKGWIPSSTSLECGGWLCDCKLRPTTKPVTKSTLRTL